MFPAKHSRSPTRLQAPPDYDLAFNDNQPGAAEEEMANDNSNNLLKVPASRRKIIEDSVLNSTKDSFQSAQQRANHVMNFKDFRGFKRVTNIKDRYKIGRVLGEGSFGQVRIALHRQANVKCAIKIVRKDKLSGHEILEDLMKNELLILEETSHPNIMRIYELLNDDKFYFVVSEFIRYGELYDFIVERSNSVSAGALTEREVIKIVKQLFMALNYVHSRKIVHRDIKPENILLESLDKLEIKLTDFGFATYFNEKDKLEDQLGSPLYMPPEIAGRGTYDSKVDIWSAGVVTHILLSGRPPFLGQTKEEVYKAIKEDPLNFQISEWSNISVLAQDFVEKTLEKDPDRRLSASECLDHPWLAATDQLGGYSSIDAKLDHVSGNIAQFCVASNF